MATRFIVDKILITREDDNGNVLATPTIIPICVSGFSLKEAPTYDEKKCLTSSTKKMVEKDIEYSGGVTIDANAEIMPVILTHICGERLSLADALTEDRADSTVYEKDNEVNFDATYSLKCVRGGTSGATPPTITALGRVGDGDVIWIAIYRLLKTTYSMQKKTPTFRVEYALKDNTDFFYKQFTGVEMSNLPLTLSGDTSVMDLGLDFKPNSAMASTDADWVENLSAITGAKIADINVNYYGGNIELNQVKVNDVLVGDYDEVTITIDKQLTSKNMLNAKKRTTSDLQSKGTMTKEFMKEDYVSFQAKEYFDLKMIVTSLIGAFSIFNFKKVEPQFADPEFDNFDNVIIKPEINALEDTNGSLVYVECVAPSLASGGVIIGDGSY